MSKLNRHQLMGRLVEDVETRYLPSGACAIKLRVVTDDGYYDTKKNEYVKRPTYHTISKLARTLRSPPTSKRETGCTLKANA
jgi:single-stranded DNA-binding protein